MSSEQSAKHVRAQELIDAITVKGDAERERRAEGRRSGDVRPDVQPAEETTP